MCVPQVNADDPVLEPQNKLEGNYPNPFNPTTTISFQVSGISSQDIELEVYNIKGQKVKDLTTEANAAVILSGVEGAAVKSKVTWNGTDENGRSVPSGIYYYRLKTDSASLTRKMLLLK
jgi:flagellar hook assembly protein FlgD